MTPCFRPPFSGSWGAGLKNSVSGELFQSMKDSIEDAYCLGKPDIAVATTDHRVHSFAGSNFKSAFGKYCKRTLSERSPDKGRSSSVSKRPVTSRPPSGRRSAEPKILDPHWFDRNRSTRSQSKTGDRSESLEDRLANMKSVADQMAVRADDGDDLDLENGENDGVQVDSSDEAQYLGDQES